MLVRICGSLSWIVGTEAFAHDTPKENLLECEVLESSLLGGKPKTLREYAEDNLKLKKFREQNFRTNGFSKADHPRRVYDEFIKEDFIPEDK